jgi:hypothetical protein
VFALGMVGCAVFSGLATVALFAVVGLDVP